MLVLSRRAEERIMIGDEIVVTILEIHHDYVRIGIDAPRSVDVHREEVYRLVQAANVAAEGGAHDEELASLKGLGQQGEALEWMSPTGKPLPGKTVARLKKQPRPPKDG